MHNPGISPNDRLLWYKDAIIYELHIKAFCDGNGDGTGDFAGLLEKLDYLQNLGVTAIWVLPFYPSPLRDDGYDIADYYNINSSYGNIDQLHQFIREAHQRNLKVITELVINHTSDQHPWFQRARRSPKGSPERDYYVWADDANKYSDVRIIFQDFEKSNWTWDPEAQQYYWHRFFHHQPDLNYDSQLVQEEVFRIIDYWCQMGVDGFRLDAVPYLFEREGTNGENLPETHAFLKKLRRHVDEKFPTTVFLAEANMWPEDSASYFGNGDECHMNYHFPVMPRIFMALRMEDRYPITDIFDQTPEIPDNCQWAIFLRNHDELTLEMVTDEERDYMYKVYAKDPKARINLGIRHRLAPLLENNRRKIELLNCLLFSLKGTPVIYYGDEIGMGDNFYLGDRDGVRTPMQWSPDRNAGFSKANPQKLYLPLILDPEYHYESVNVETQLRNPSSLLWFMKRMINMRKKYKAFGRGDMKFVSGDNPKVLAFTRAYQNEVLLVIVNLSRHSQPVWLDLNNYRGYQLIEMFSKNKFPVIKETDPYFLTLDSYAYEWFVLEKVNEPVMENIPLSIIQIEEWKSLADKTVLEEIANNIVPGYLVKTPWFIGKQRTINGITLSILATIPVGEQLIFMLLAEVAYESGLPEYYHLPVGLASEQEALAFSAEFPYAIISKITVGGKDYVLCDALFLQPFQRSLITLLAAGEPIRLNNSSLTLTGNEGLKSYVATHPEIRSRVVPAMFSYTAITYDNSYYLKMYRMIDRTTNPDVEMTRVLSTNQFPAVPAFIGTINWLIDNEVFTLGMIQTLVEYHGNGSTYMQERLRNINEKTLARDTQNLPSLELKGSFVEPLPLEELPDNLREFLGGVLAEGARMLGTRTAEMHLLLDGSNSDRDFAAEPFSLHYQRSLFAGMQTLVRTALDNLARKLPFLPAEVASRAQGILSRRQEVLDILKQIYTKKFNVTKTRVHGYFILEQVLFTGKDVAFPYLGGSPFRTFSERRLKRSPLRDIANMIRSFQFAAYSAARSNQLAKDQPAEPLPYYTLWAHYAIGFFMHSYLSALGKASFVPENKDDLALLLRVYLLELSLQELNYELDNRPEWVSFPLDLIEAICVGKIL